MIKRLTFAGFCLALVSVAQADTGANDVSKPEESEASEETRSGLDAFVETAIRGGLLVPNEDAPTEEEIAAQKLADCGGAYPLDFSVVRSLRRYTELDQARGNPDELSSDEKLIADMKAKLALGLYPEANAIIASAPDDKWVAYRKFIELMESRKRPDPEYFASLVECYPEANLWLGVAQLAVFDPAGVEHIAANTATIRTLPHTLREDVAMQVIPSLIVERRPDLAQLIITAFTPEEIEGSVRLNALKTAILDMPDGSESSERLVMLMSQPKLKLAALLILVERDGGLRPTVHSFVLEEAWKLLEETESHHNLDPIVAFVIRHLGSSDLRSGLDRVRGLSIAERPDVKASIEDYTIDVIDTYIADDNPATAINALHTLDAYSADLPVNPRGNDLRKRGAQKALELGFFSMVKRILAPVPVDQQVALMLAQAAYWSGVDQDLFDMRAAFPSEIEINRMAGIRALQADLPAIARAAFEGLASDPSKQLELLEQGAVENNWTLWTTNLGPLVAGLTDDEVIRLDRVRRIQQASRAAPESERDIRPYQIADLLKTSRQRLTGSQAGAENEQ